MVIYSRRCVFSQITGAISAGKVLARVVDLRILST